MCYHRFDGVSQSGALMKYVPQLKPSYKASQKAKDYQKKRLEKLTRQYTAPKQSGHKQLSPITSKRLMNQQGRTEILINAYAQAKQTIDLNLFDKNLMDPNTVSKTRFLGRNLPSRRTRMNNFHPTTKPLAIFRQHMKPSPDQSKPRPKPKKDKRYEHELEKQRKQQLT